MYLEYQLSILPVLTHSSVKTEHAPFCHLQLIMSSEATSTAECFLESHQGP